MLMKGSLLAALAIIGAFVAGPSVSSAAFTEDFSSLANDPDWQSPDNGWQFLSDTSAQGTVNNAIEGDVIAGGPGGRYGQFTGPNNSSGVYHAGVDPVAGTFSFLAMIPDDNTVDETAQLRFFLGAAANGGIANGADQRPVLYFNKSSTPGKLRLQLNRGGGNGYVNSLTDMNLGQWYRYTITYDLNNDFWDLAVSDLSNATVFSEAGTYDPDVSNFGAYTNATWERRYGSTGSLDGPALQWNIDQINLPIPEPTSLALVAMGGLALLGRRRQK